MKTHRVILWRTVNITMASNYESEMEGDNEYYNGDNSDSSNHQSGNGVIKFIGMVYQKVNGYN